jgi:RNA polymerase sigma-70 factor (ECF subfamily)
LPELSDRNHQFILAQVAAGDIAAFNRLFEEYSSKIYSFAHHFSRSDADAKDAVQDIFIKVWTRRETLTEIQDFDAYLFRCARNRFLTSFKQAARIILKEDFSETDQVASGNQLDSLEIKEMDARLNSGVESLPNKQKETYKHRKEEGLSTRETAETMGISQVTVKEHLGKALKTLRKIHLDYNNLQLIILLGSFFPFL